MRVNETTQLLWWVALYWQPEVLAGDVKWLQSNGYVIPDFDAGDWKSE
jgi:hypothetical protein